MKLTKIQQDVVDKMRNGWVLGTRYLFKDKEFITISKATLRALIKRNLIAKMNTWPYGHCLLKR